MLKKLTSVLLCVAMVFGLPFVTLKAYAEAEYPESRLSPTLIPGDLDGDARITASDARMCLRASVGLQTLTPSQKQAADVFGDGENSAANARKILRVSVRLDRFEIVLQVGESYTLPALKSAGSGQYNWNCLCLPAIGIQVTEDIADPWGDSSVMGTPLETTYTFLAQIPGTYIVSLKLKASWENEPINEISFIIKVVDVTLKVGDSYILPPLKNPASGKADWICEVTPSNGVILTRETLPLDPRDDTIVEGTPTKTTYTFVAQNPGTYTVALKLIAAGQAEPGYDNSFKIEVTQ